MKELWIQVVKELEGQLGYLDLRIFFAPPIVAKNTVVLKRRAAFLILFAILTHALASFIPRFFDWEQGDALTCF